MKEIIALLEEASGLPKDALAAFVKADGSIDTDAAPELLKQARTGIATKLKEAGEVGKEKGKELFDNGYKKAKGEVLNEYESGLAAELGVDGKLRGKELRDAIKASKGASDKGVPDKDAIEKSPFFLDTVEKLKTEHEEKLKALQGEFDGFKGDVKKNEVKGQVWNYALPIIDEAKPAYSDQESVKNFQMDAVRKGILDDHEFDIQGKRIVVLDKEGKVAKDELGNPIEFKNLVSSVVTTRVGVMQSEKRGSAAVPPGQKGAEVKGEWKGEAIKSEDDLTRIISDRSISIEQRTAAKQTWEASKQKAVA